MEKEEDKVEHVNAFIPDLSFNSAVQNPYWTEHKGATDTFASESNYIRWQHKMGDWLDKNGILQGSSPIDSNIVSANNKLKLEFVATTSVVNWLKYPTKNNGFYLSSNANKNGRFHVYSHEYQQNAPRLHIYTQKNKVTLIAKKDITLVLGSRHSAGHLDYLTFKNKHVNLLYFDLTKIDIKSTDVTSAKITLEKYGVHRGGNVNVEVFTVAPLPIERPISYGLAEQYYRDFGIENDSKVLIAENFDNDEWLVRLSDTRPYARYNIIKPATSDNQYSPLIGDALATEFNPSQNLAFTGRYQLKELVGHEPQSLYFRYYLRLGDNWASILGGKFPGIAGTYNKAGWGGRKVNGVNGWSARGFFSTSVPNGEPFEGSTPLGSYVYHPDFNNRYGEGVMWGTARSSLVKNRWYCIEQHIKLNDLGQKNGELNVWIDGIPTYSRTNFRFRDVDSLKIESVWIDFYHGGTKKPKTIQQIYIDNIVIATEYIGPIKAVYE